MSDALPLHGQVMIQRMQRRRLYRLVVYMTFAAGFSGLGQFVPLLGAEPGAVHWTVTVLSLAVLAWALWMLGRTKQRLNGLLHATENLG